MNGTRLRKVGRGGKNECEVKSFVVKAACILTGGQHCLGEATGADQGAGECGAYAQHLGDVDACGRGSYRLHR